MPKIRTEISIESNERLTIRKKRYSVRSWCDQCRRVSIMVLPTEAAFLSCRDIDAVIGLIYAGDLHVRSFQDKGLFVCMTSLCLYPFESEFTGPTLREYEEPAEILADLKTTNYNFINEE